MASVYLARDRQLDRNVALKMLHPQFASDPAFAERLRREARAAAGLSHPNIVGVYDWGREGERYFIAMEYVSGRSLAEIIAVRGALDAKSATTIAFEVASALAVAHRGGMVHRDVKPQNVLLSTDGHVKVTDFGIAGLIGRGGSSGLTETGTVVGTAAYLSPEQACGEPTDARSDLYSLGVVLYEMLSGQRPFTGETPVAVAYQHVADPPVPLGEITGGVPQTLEAITMRLLAKDPEARYEKAADLARHLGMVREQFERPGAGAPAPSPAEQPRRAEQPPSKRPASLPPAPPPPRRPVSATPARRQDAGPAAEARRRPPRPQVRRSTPRGITQWWTGRIPDSRRPPGYRERPGGYRGGSRDVYGRIERQRRSGFFFVGFAVLLVVLLILVVVLVNVLSPEDNGGPDEPATVAVPSVFQLEEAVAVRTLESAGFPVLTVREANVEIPPGRVFDQQPRAGAKLEPGSTITLTISAGASAVPVPNILGWQAIDAERALRSAGFDVNLVQVGSDRPSGEVLQQEPAPLVPHDIGTAVTLNISAGPSAILVPTVAGLDAVDAAVALTNAGLVVMRRTEPSGTAAEGVVTRTEPPAGSQLAEGSQVFVYESSGPDLVRMPDLTGLNPTTAFIQLDTLGVVADLVEVAPLPGEEPGVIVTQDPEPGTTITPSSVLTIFVTGAAVPPIIEGETPAEPGSDLETSPQAPQDGTPEPPAPPTEESG